MSSAQELSFDLDRMDAPMPWMRELNAATARGLVELRCNGDPEHFGDALDILETPASDYWSKTTDATVGEYLTPQHGALLEQYRDFQDALENSSVTEEAVERAESIYHALTDIEQQFAYKKFSTIF